MPFDGNGTYNLPAPSYPAVAGTLIEAAARNTIDEDLQAALSNCITKDGQTAAPSLNAPVLLTDPVTTSNDSSVPSTRWVRNAITAPASNAASKMYAFANFL